MKKFQKGILLFSFLLIFVACGKKGVYDYSEKEKEDLAYAMIYGGATEEEKKEYFNVINELDRISNDRRKSEEERIKAVKELNSWFEKIEIFSKEKFEKTVDKSSVSI